MVTPQDRLIVCKKHRTSANVSQVDLEREKLGFDKRIFV